MYFHGGGWVSGYVTGPWCRQSFYPITFFYTNFLQNPISEHYLPNLNYPRQLSATPCRLSPLSLYVYVTDEGKKQGVY